MGDELVDVPGDGLLGAAGQVGGGDAQRQRQVAAGDGEGVDRVGFGGEAVGSEYAAEQRDRVGRR